MYAMINRRKFWNEKLTVSIDAREEIDFWLQKVESLNGRQFVWSPSATRVAYSDASSSGYGGYTVEVGPHCQAQFDVAGAKGSIYGAASTYDKIGRANCQMVY